MSKKLAVVGGGSSGIVAAIEAKTELPQATVTIFEKMPKACKKILVTGNGRCNCYNNQNYNQYFPNHSLYLHVFYPSRGMLLQILSTIVTFFLL